MHIYARLKICRPASPPPSDGKPADRHHVQGTASKAYAQRGVKSVVIAYSSRPRIEMAVTQAYVELIAARAYTQKQTGVVSHAFPVGLAQTRCRRAAHVQGHAVATAKCVAQSAAQQRSLV